MPPTPSKSRTERSRKSSSLNPTPYGRATASVQPSNQSRRQPTADTSFPFHPSSNPSAISGAAATALFPNGLASATAAGLAATSNPGLTPNNVQASKGRRPFNHRNLFQKDLRNLMYAFGDVANPDPDSVALLEDMTVEFLTDLCCRARPSPYALGLGTSNLSNSSSSSSTSSLLSSIGPQEVAQASILPSDNVASVQANIGSNNVPNANASAATNNSNNNLQAPHTSSSNFTSQTLPPRAPHRVRVKIEDFRHALRKDVEFKKLSRLEQLLYADKVVTEARRIGGIEDVAERSGALINNPPNPSNDPKATTSNSAAEGEDQAEDVEDHVSGGKAGGRGGREGGGKVAGKSSMGSAKKGSAARSSAKSKSTTKVKSSSVAPSDRGSRGPSLPGASTPTSALSLPGGGGSVGR
ncbi:hypothetical protein IE53DRAFT_387885 [Violaceomyces palustris]|uniref:Uncharacterized protein n=1 Tax=Violaceomyces palustris TaxID=1673888 RepID=A0ACD0NVN0_9BASI|nr:hypothetical protein IE53DRAFT_387885 [Violaceomyces palustris]